MKTILVLTDFSERSEAAAEYAMLMAIEMKANMVLCHVSEVTAHIADGLEFTWPMADYLQLKNESIAGLKVLATRLKELLEKNCHVPAIGIVAEFGLLHEVAAAVIAEKSASLVVIGEQGFGGLSRLLFGSHTYSVLDNLNLPVLLVPEPMQFNGIKTLAYATDRTFNDGKVISYLAGFAKHFSADISVSHFAKPALPLAESEQAVEYRLNERLEKREPYPHVVYHNISAAKVTDSLMQLMASGNIDMLALVHKRYSFFEGLFHSSVSKHVAGHAQVPLLILPYAFSLDVADITVDQLDDYCYSSDESR